MPTTILGRKAYDLTQPISPRTPRSSDHPQVRFDTLRWRTRHGQVTHTVTMSVHISTHVDAPLMYYHDGLSVDRFPLDALCGSAVVVDCQREDWGAITADDLSHSAVPIQAGDIVVLHTGAHHYYDNEERYMLKAPGLTKDAIDWLVAKKVKALGSDSPSAEHFFSRWRRWTEMRPDIVKGLVVDEAKFPPSYGHKTLLKAGIFMLESLGGEIDQILNKRVDLIALPLKYEGVEAAQVRALALDV